MYNTVLTLPSRRAQCSVPRSRDPTLSNAKHTIAISHAAASTSALPTAASTAAPPTAAAAFPTAAAAAAAAVAAAGNDALVYHTPCILSADLVIVCSIGRGRSAHPASRHRSTGTAKRAAAATSPAAMAHQVFPTGPAQELQAAAVLAHNLAAFPAVVFGCYQQVEGLAAHHARFCCSIWRPLREDGRRRGWGCLRLRLRLRLRCEQPRRGCAAVAIDKHPGLVLVDCAFIRSSHPEASRRRRRRR